VITQAVRDSKDARSGSGHASRTEPLRGRRHTALIEREPAVSVVIPTGLRPSVRRALASVRDQSYKGQVQVVVVVDKSAHGIPADTLEYVADADVILFTGGGRGAAVARNQGVESATGEIVAYLDDDDEWAPQKLELQTSALRTTEGYLDERLVVGCRVVERHAAGSMVTQPIPVRTIEAGQPIEDYLFRARRPGLGRASFFTSCTMATRALAEKVPWKADLRRHQDWDWLIRAQYDAGVQFQQIDDALTIYAVGSTESISAKADWRSSLDWARTWRGRWDSQTYVDFIAAQCLRYAVQGRSSVGLRACLAELRDSGTAPGIGPTFMALGSLVPRRILERQAVWLAQRGVV